VGKKKPEEMTEQELRDELMKVRAERSGQGRQRRAAARTKRVEGIRKDAKKRSDAKAIEEADWV